MAAAGLSRTVPLPGSDQRDVVLCGATARVALDSDECEVLVGTYGGQVLVYRALPEATAGGGEATPAYELLWRRDYAYPVYAVQEADVDLDGVRELVVVSLRGVHIMQVCVRTKLACCAVRPPLTVRLAMHSGGARSRAARPAAPHRPRPGGPGAVAGKVRRSIVIICTVCTHSYV